VCRFDRKTVARDPPCHQKGTCHEQLIGSRANPRKIGEEVRKGTTAGPGNAKPSSLSNRAGRLRWSLIGGNPEKKSGENFKVPGKSGV